MQGHAVEKRRFLRLCNSLVVFGRGRQQIALVLLQIFPALNRAWRRNACHHLIERRAECIDISRRALYAVAVILLLGRIAVLDDHGHALAAVVDSMARSTEIDQPDAAVLQNHDVVRRDVPVNHSAVMDPLQRQHDRRQHGNRFLRRNPSLRRDSRFLFQILAQRDTVEIFHHEIGRFVCGEAVVDVDNAFLILKRGQALCFVQEFFLAKLEIFAFFSCKNSQAALAGAAGSILAGQIFLDCNLMQQQRVPREISHAEAAMPQCAANDVALFQDCARPHIGRKFRLGSLCIAAVRADVERVVVLLKASKADFHVFPLFLRDSARPGLRLGKNIRKFSGNVSVLLIYRAGYGDAGIMVLKIQTALSVLTQKIRQEPHGAGRFFF